MAKKHVILFAGTTEGRILANWLDEQSGVTGRETSKKRGSYDQP